VFYFFDGTKILYSCAIILRSRKYLITFGFLWNPASSFLSSLRVFFNSNATALLLKNVSRSFIKTMVLDTIFKAGLILDYINICLALKITRTDETIVLLALDKLY
jgi:hypothetical protein